MGHGRATDKLVVIVAVITAEQGRQGCGSGNSSMPTIQQTDAVKCTISGPTRMAGQNTGKRWQLSQKELRLPRRNEKE